MYLEQSVGLFEGVEGSLSPVHVVLILVRMDQDGHPPELLLSLIYAGVGVDLEDLEWIEIPIGVTRLGKSFNLSGWGEVLISLLNLKQFL